MAVSIHQPVRYGVEYLDIGFVRTTIVIPGNLYLDDILVVYSDFFNKAEGYTGNQMMSCLIASICYQPGFQVNFINYSGRTMTNFQHITIFYNKGIERWHGTFNS